MTFHGWLQIELREIEAASRADNLQREEDAIVAVRKRIDSILDMISYFDVRRSGNGLIVLTAHGVRNHRNEQVIDLFRWSVAEFPESFGLLYIWDSEHPEHDNCFRVYRCARGNCVERDDPHLSPCIPTIEAPYEYEAEQDTAGQSATAE